MKEYRCVKCKKLLFKLTPKKKGIILDNLQDVENFKQIDDILEIKCTRCNKINKIALELIIK